MKIDWDNWNKKNKPHGISGCFRLRNEQQYMERAVYSHLKYLDEAVLVVQPSDDDTVELAHQMAEENPKINTYLYDAVPDWIDTKGFYEKDPNSFGHLVHMSNFALSKCKYSWIAKTEGDVICLSTFNQIRAIIDSQPPHNVYYGRVILNLAGEDQNMISWENPRNGGWDEAVFPNNPDYKFTRVSKWEVIQPPAKKICMGWSALHMKRCKEGMTDGWNGETYVSFHNHSLANALSLYNEKHPYPAHDDPLGILELFEKEWL